MKHAGEHRPNESRERVPAEEPLTVQSPRNRTTAQPQAEKRTGEAAVRSRQKPDHSPMQAEKQTGDDRCPKPPETGPQTARQPKSRPRPGRRPNPRNQTTDKRCGWNEVGSRETAHQREPSTTAGEPRTNATLARARVFLAAHRGPQIVVSGSTASLPEYADSCAVRLTDRA